jgi:signal transduction histidine kinase
MNPTVRTITIDTALAAFATLAVLLTVGKLSGLSGQLINPANGINMNPANVACPDSQACPGYPGGAMVLATATTVPLAIRRLCPLTAFWVVLGAAAATPRYEANVITLYAVVLAAYSAVVYSRFRWAAVLSMLAASLLAAGYLGKHHTASSLPSVGTAIVVLAGVVGVGNAMRQWRRRADDSKARLLRLQAEHEAVTRRALELERARIASELHDVVTHNVAVMIVQAGAARQVLDGAPDEARAALLAVEASGRAAMAELRHLLGLISPGQELRPQLGLEQLRPLVDRLTATGLPVELHVNDLPPGLPAGIDLAAFRVVQEALTNVIKHAGKPLTSVTLGYRDGGLIVEVADAGAPSTAPGSAVPGAGRGLLGLRERTALYGGDLEAGPQPGGGWLVRARIPVDPAGPADLVPLAARSR